jgi:hypothetical protein
MQKKGSIAIHHQVMPMIEASRPVLHVSSCILGSFFLILLFSNVHDILVAGATRPLRILMADLTIMSMPAMIILHVSS